ncbi:MAG: hypothetical protein RSD35_10240 [Oscillospiraceae bacterium]
MFIDFPPVNVLVEGMENIHPPKLVCICQKYDPEKIENIPAHLYSQLSHVQQENYDGKSIAITAGSRGIPHIDVILRSLCSLLKEWGARPFIVPAMGSHGGGTAQGQAELLAGYNITESNIGAPVVSSMEVVQYGELEGIPLYCDRAAFESDGVVILNKIKPHTDFRGEIESGLCKMMTIGISKHKGASMFHTLGFARFSELIPAVATKFLASVPVKFGIGIVQNAYDEICNIEVLTPDSLIEGEKRLLNVAKEKIAHFLFPSLDVLLIDEIGKNISGFGQDPNIVGRINSGLPGFDDVLNLQRLFIRGLSEETHHNGCGIAAADVTTRSCLNSIDWDTTWTNTITSTQLNGGKIPVYMNNDFDAICLAIRTCNGIDYPNVKLARIKNTLCMSKIEVSEALYEQIKEQKNIQYISGPYAMSFDAMGMLL